MGAFLHVFLNFKSVSTLIFLSIRFKSTCLTNLNFFKTFKTPRYSNYLMYVWLEVINFLSVKNIPIIFPVIRIFLACRHPVYWNLIKLDHRLMNNYLIQWKWSGVLTIPFKLKLVLHWFIEELDCNGSILNN